MDDFADKIRGSGKRLTAQRTQILRAVERLGHATPDEVLAEVRREAPSINISTIYRNLEVLEELQLVRHTHLSDRAPTYHSVSGHEHFHLVCRSCHRVTSVDPEMLGGVVDRLSTEHRFVPDIGHLTMFGLCADCADGGSPTDAP